MSRIEVSVQTSGGFLTPRHGIFKSIESSSVLDPVSGNDNFPTHRVLFKEYASNTRGIVLLKVKIHSVLSVGSESKIFPPVVAFVKVPVIYLLGGPFPRHPEPRQLVYPVASVDNLDSYITFLVDAAGGDAWGRELVAPRHSSGKVPGIWIIKEKVPHKLGSKLISDAVLRGYSLLSHLASPRLCWSKLRRSISPDCFSLPLLYQPLGVA